MNRFTNKVSDQGPGTWPISWVAVGAAAAVALVGSLVVLALPDRYEASASVFVDTDTSRPPVQDVAVDVGPDPDQNFVQGAWFSAASVYRIAREGGVLPVGTVDARRQKQLLDDMSQRFHVRGGEKDRAGTIFHIGYQDPNRARSLRVMGILLDVLANEALDLQKARLRKPADTARSVRFEIVQPPTASLRPVWPPRRRFITEILVAAIVAGPALACVLMNLPRETRAG